MYILNKLNPHFQTSYLYSESNTFYCATCSNWFLIKSSDEGNSQQYSPPNKGVYGMFRDDMRLPKSKAEFNQSQSRYPDPNGNGSSSKIPNAQTSTGQSTQKLVIIEHVSVRYICFCVSSTLIIAHLF